MTDHNVRPDEYAAPAGAMSADEQAKVAELVETLARESADYKDRLLRSLAEMENLRKRTERQVADMRHYGIASFAADVLAVADNMHRALEAAADDRRRGQGVHRRDRVDRARIAENPRQARREEIRSARRAL
jgi:molecular chaperone GrpE